MEIASFVRSLPKAELHVHIEGTLEPELMFSLAKRNDIKIPFTSIDEIRAAYKFTDLQSFLDIYYQGAEVLVTEQDFYDLMIAYLERASDDGVRRAEIFFDAQTHTQRGIGFDVFMSGFTRAIEDAATWWGISAGLIMCFLRHLPAGDAIDTWEASEPFRADLVGVGLDSSEIGNPPDPFGEPFALARAAGLRTVAHAGEEGPPSFITGALDILKAERIDHGVRSEDDPRVVKRLIADQVPMTMCPLSNVKLNVFATLEDHSLKRLLDQGVKVTVNSDDPSYFGGYVLDNYVAIAEALKLTRDDLVKLARNSIEASFLSDDDKSDLLEELAAVSIG
ncbi:MAG: adenosine deaminase [Acidimicrobiia bacterium]|nr:MAG: adenosine deaminase [Acidimicrobiia bacterium]